MHILTDHKRDNRTAKMNPGAYEWWYFDGVDEKEEVRFVVIFYEGNPFSTRYIKRINERHRSQDSLAKEHPAVSISIYEHDKPIYYSFTEYQKEECHFDETDSKVAIGGHSLNWEMVDGKLVYHLNLKEKLPSGNSLVGSINLKSEPPSPGLIGNNSSSSSETHFWNLVQPRGTFDARFKIYARNEESRNLKLNGTGYHDHNLGEEPMRNEFKEWYWGRFHFEIGTLIYYLVSFNDREERRAWLISGDNSRILQEFKSIRLEDYGFNIFGLRSARKIILSNEESHVTIQQTTPIDNGPFYQRFDSNAFLNLPKDDVMEFEQGITEYIRPDRIYWKIFWPLLNMRIRYTNESPHWVQQSKNLYRLTW